MERALLFRPSPPAPFPIQHPLRSCLSPAFLPAPSLLHGSHGTPPQVLRPVPLSEEMMHTFHTKEYISFLKSVTPENQEKYSKELKSFAFVSDCPVFDRIFEYCQVREREIWVYRDGVERGGVGRQRRPGVRERGEAVSETGREGGRTEVGALDLTLSFSPPPLRPTPSLRSTRAGQWVAPCASITTCRTLSSTGAGGCTTQRRQR
jgi:hypothetical protein